MNQLEESFGDYFRRLRRSKGFKSQKDLASLSGISQATISRIEDGSQIPTEETLRVFSKVLDTPFPELMVKSGNMTFDVWSDTLWDDDSERDSYINYFSEDIFMGHVENAWLNAISKDEQARLEQIEKNKNDLYYFLITRKPTYRGIEITEADLNMIATFLRGLFHDREKN